MKLLSPVYYVKTPPTPPNPPNQSVSHHVVEDAASETLSLPLLGDLPLEDLQSTEPAQDFFKVTVMIGQTCIANEAIQLQFICVRTVNISRKKVKYLSNHELCRSCRYY